MLPRYLAAGFSDAVARLTGQAEHRTVDLYAFMMECAGQPSIAYTGVQGKAGRMQYINALAADAASNHSEWEDVPKALKELYRNGYRWKRTQVVQ